jgi:hypothetical protein
MPKVTAGRGIHRHKLAVVVAEKDQAARGGYGARPTIAAAGHGIFPALFAGARIERAQIEFARLFRDGLAAGAREVLHRLRRFGG